MSFPPPFLPQVPVSPSTMELPKSRSHDIALVFSLAIQCPLVFAEKNGEVDWHTLGNILVAHALGEVCELVVGNPSGSACMSHMR